MKIKQLEDDAVTVVAGDIAYSMAQGKHMVDYDEDDALAVLVQHGIRPSILGLDLDYVIHKANRMIARGEFRP